MAGYKYQDQDNRPPFAEAGDYIVQVTGLELGLSKAGNEKIDLTLEIEKTKTLLFDTLTFVEKAAWRIDTFLKSCGVSIPKGVDVEFDPDRAAEAVQDGKTFVPVLGLRGWATLFVDEYPQGSGKKKNKVMVWITNKEKLPRLNPAPAPVTAGKSEDDGLPF